MAWRKAGWHAASPPHLRPRPAGCAVTEEVLRGGGQARSSHGQAGLLLRRLLPQRRAGLIRLREADPAEGMVDLAEATTDLAAT